MGAVIESTERPYQGESNQFLDRQTTEFVERLRRNEQEAYDRAIAADKARIERERSEVRARDEAKQAQSAARQQAYAAWGLERNRLRDAVAELRGALRSAEDRGASSGDMDEAVRAVAERDVFALRLQRAESDFAAHAQREPRWYGG
jgi:hypothetical protein